MNDTFSLKVDIGPMIDINSDHDCLQLDMYFDRNRKSRNERRTHFRIQDYLRADDNFTKLLDNKIKQILRDKVPECKLLSRRYNGRNN